MGSGVTNFLDPRRPSSHQRTSLPANPPTIRRRSVLQGAGGVRNELYISWVGHHLSHPKGADLTAICAGGVSPRRNYPPHGNLGAGRAEPIRHLPWPHVPCDKVRRGPVRCGPCLDPKKMVRDGSGKSADPLWVEACRCLMPVSFVIPLVT